MFESTYPVARRADETGAIEIGRAHSRRELLLALTLFCAVPFLNFGVSWWISVQGVAFGVAAIGVKKTLAIREWLMCSIVAIAMLIGLLWHLDSTHLLTSILSSSRQALTVFLIICAARNVSWRVPPRFYKALIVLLVLSLCLLTIAQFVSYQIFRSPHFFVPSSFYFFGRENVASSRLEFGRMHGFLTATRVSATYAEPSYLGFVCLSLALLILNGDFAITRGLLLLSLLVGTVALSKSASGIVTLILLIGVAYRSRLSLLNWIAVVIAIASILIIASSLLKFNPLERIANSANPAVESSGYVRLILPLKNLATVLADYPLGVPLADTYPVLLGEAIDRGTTIPVQQTEGRAQGADNGLLNIIVEFGWAGIMVIAAVAYAVRSPLILLFLLLTTQFNGSALGPDKAALICLALSCRPSRSSVR